MSTNTFWRVDQFTSLDDIKGVNRSDDVLVLRTIMKNGARFSVFDASNDAIARTLTRICASDWVTIDEKSGFPWTALELTDAGRKALGMSPAVLGSPTGGDA